MFLIRLRARLESDRDQTGEDVADMIEAIIDDLDATTHDPRVATDGLGHVVDLSVDVKVEAANIGEAEDKGRSAIHAALHAAGINTAGMLRLARIEAQGAELLDA